MVTKRSPKAWIAVAVALSLAILGVGLGVWQLGRADDKRSMVNARLERQLALALGLDQPWKPGLAAQSLDQQVVTLTGRWRHDKSIVLDNRAWEGRAGVHVLTPLQLPDKSLVWVNRGWAPKAPGALAPGEFKTPPLANDPNAMTGVALASVMRRIELSDDPQQLRQGLVWQNFDWTLAQQRVSGNVWPVIVWQTSDNADGLLRRVPEVASDVPKHLGYALQWFLMSAVALFFAWRLKPRS